MSDINKEYQSLLTEYSNARKYFMSYLMKVTYGFRQDITYNTEMVDYWDGVIKSTREKIIKYNEQHR